MPWDLEWADHALHVHISSPVPPLQDLMREIAKRTVAGTHAVYLPTVIQGGSDEDQGFIRELWRAVTDSGRVVLRSPEAEDPPGR